MTIHSRRPNLIPPTVVGQIINTSVEEYVINVHFHSFVLDLVCVVLFTCFSGVKKIGFYSSSDLSDESVFLFMRRCVVEELLRNVRSCSTTSWYPPTRLCPSQTSYSKNLRVFAIGSLAATNHTRNSESQPALVAFGKHGALWTSTTTVQPTIGAVVDYLFMLFICTSMEYSIYKLAAQQCPTWITYVGHEGSR